MKVDDVPKTVDLDVSTSLAEQTKDPVLGTVRSWVRRENSSVAKSPKTQYSRGVFRYCQNFDRLLIEEERQLLGYNEPFDRLEDDNLPTCFPLPLYLASLRLGNYN